MCIALPGRVLQIVDAGTARVDVRGTPRTVSLGLLDVRSGDWVLVGMGLVLERISETDAAETLRLLDDLEGVSGEVDRITSRAPDRDDGGGAVANAALESADAREPEGRL